MRHEKARFINGLHEFANELTNYVSTNSGDWSIKGFIDIDKNIYSISTDTKIISKILETQLFPMFQKFADGMGYEIVLSEKQNWYPDLSFVKKADSKIKFAVDIKTTYRLDEYEGFCNGFTLGSHGEYFRNRRSTKNIQFPYSDYMAHITLGIIYTRTKPTYASQVKTMRISELSSVPSVIKDFLFFIQEKWRISSDRRGSGNTANIGSIHYIPDLLSGNGVFSKLGESIFDEYWMNQGTLQVPNPKEKGHFKKLTKLAEFIEFKGLDPELMNPPKPKRK